MKLLKDILYGVRIVEVDGSTNIAVESVTPDSRAVKNLSLFVAIKGTQTNGHAFIDKAILQGCVAIICEEMPEVKNAKVTYVAVNDSAAALGIIASNYYDNPSEQIKLVGITGTNGKTTTATLLYNLFKKLGFKTALFSTVVNKIHNEEIAATHTTPDPVKLNALLREAVDKGCTYAFMEVSSHAVHQKRIAGIQFTGAVFTNITHDHLDYHGTFDEYLKAKKGFFDQLGSDAFALLNKDDYHADEMITECRAKVYTYGIKSMVDYKCKVVENQFTGLMLNIDGKEVWTKLIGGFNAYNITAAYAVSKLLGQDELNVLTAISSLNNVEGRFQYIKSENEVMAIVDYAHTPDALKNVLSTINDIRTGNEQVITVVGCGGDRDKGKRPLMGGIACELSDKVIFTSDNPRSEDPEKIIAEMQKGVEGNAIRKVMSLANRREAIKVACMMARPGDIILIAGKGHEKYQEIKGEKFPFDDLEEVKQSLNNIEK